MNTTDEIIEELVSLILMQNEELMKMEKKLRRIEQYIEVYEDYIKGGDE